MAILTLELPNDVAEALERLPAGERNNFAVSTLRNGLNSYRPEEQTTRETPETELGVAEAADFIGVTRPYLLTLLANGEIASRQENEATFLRISDLLRYREENKSRRLATLAELQAQAQELKMGY